MIFFKKESLCISLKNFNCLVQERVYLWVMKEDLVSVAEKSGEHRGCLFGTFLLPLVCFVESRARVKT